MFGSAEELLHERLLPTGINIWCRHAPAPKCTSSWTTGLFYNCDRAGHRHPAQLERTGFLKVRRDFAVRDLDCESPRKAYILSPFR